MQGDSLAAALRGERSDLAADRPLMLAERRGELPRLALVRGHFKLILGLPAGEPAELLLFDLAADRGESKNLISQYPGLARRLLHDLADVYRALPRFDLAGQRRYEVSQEQMDRLRALGYLQ